MPTDPPPAATVDDIAALKAELFNARVAITELSRRAEAAERERDAVDENAIRESSSIALCRQLLRMPLLQREKVINDIAALDDKTGVALPAAKEGT